MTAQTVVPSQPHRRVHAGRVALWVVLLLMALLYLMPVLIVVAGIGITSWRDKHRDEDDEDADGATTPGPTAAP